MTEQEQIKYIKKAYMCGVSCRKTGDNPSWYTPRLTLAFNLGYAGIDIDFEKIITAKRYGSLPTVCSHNFLTDSSENGVSVISIDGDDAKNWEEMFISDKKIITFRGLLINAKGSDGEYLVFPLDMTEQLDY